MVFTGPDGKYVGRNILNYPFKIIHKELGIENCRFYDLRGSYATINLRNGIEIRDVADIVYDNLMSSKVIDNIIKYEIVH